jgi:hypothetical protein
LQRKPPIKQIRIPAFFSHPATWGRVAKKMLESGFECCADCRLHICSFTAPQVPPVEIVFDGFGMFIATWSSWQDNVVRRSYINVKISPKQEIFGESHLYPGEMVSER